MKKPSTWAAIVGAIIIAGTLIGLGQSVANPTPLPLVNATMWIGQIAWIFFGAFLVSIFVRSWNKETQVETLSETDTLIKKRNWILGLVLVVCFLGSIETWILANYSEITSPQTLQVIFDCIFNLVFLYVAVNLFRGNRAVEKTLLYSVVAYSLGMVVFYALREYWFTIFAYIAFGGYFVYALKAPVNKMTFRIAHIAVLPIVVALLTVAGIFDTRALTELQKEQSYLQQQHSNDLANLNAAYVRLLDRESPDSIQYQEIRNAVEKRNETLQKIRTNLAALKAQMMRQNATALREKTFELMGYDEKFMQLHEKQSAAVLEFVDYAEGVNFAAPTQAQRNRLVELNEAITAFNDEMNRLSYEQDKANLD